MATVTTPPPTPSDAARYVWSWNPSWDNLPPPPQSCYTPAGVPWTTFEFVTVRPTWGMRCPTSKYIEPDLACYPWVSSNGLPSRPSEVRAPYPYGFWSPATKCPSGWVTVTPRTTISGLEEHKFLDGETGIDCCPKGFTYTSSDSYLYCYRETSVKPSLCYTGADNTRPLLLPKRDYAFLFQARYQASDLTATGPRTKSEVGAEEKSLSKGGIIAVALFVPLTVLVVVAVMFVFWRRRQSKVKTTPEHTDQSVGRDDDKEVAGVDSFGNTKLELEANSVPTELPGQQYNPELDATETAVVPDIELHGNTAQASHANGPSFVGLDGGRPGVGAVTQSRAIPFTTRDMRRGGAGHIANGSRPTGHTDSTANIPLVELPTSSSPPPQPVPVITITCPRPQRKWSSTVLP